LGSNKLIVGVNDLQSQFPEIAAEAFGWDPSTVTKGSHRKKQWKCNLGHIWDAQIKSRALLKTGCPICSGNKVLAGFNDLKTKFPDIAAEAYMWDPTIIIAGSTSKKTWKCNLGHIWDTSLNERTSNKSGCPVCSGHQVLAGFNDLQTKFPDIAAEAYMWDPQLITSKSNKIREWKCNEGHIYSSNIANRTIRGDGCPVCSGREVLAGFNDLKTKFPDIAAEAYGWDPATVTAGSGKKQDWECNMGHIYTSAVYSRTSDERTGCPVCSGREVLAGFNDLKTKFPDIAAEAYGWDPATVTAGRNQKKDWICIEGHIYTSAINNRTNGKGCAICSGHQVLAGFNDLQTKFPEIAAEAYMWDPSTVVVGTPQKKDWKCNKGHIYFSSVAARTSNNGTGCPVCSGHQVLAGFNDLQTKFPDIAAEAYMWDPQLITSKSNKIREWKCNEGHIYSSNIANRTIRGDGCPVCSGREVLAGFNDLKTKFPDIAAEAYGWDPATVTKGSNLKKNWKCNKGHIYNTMVAHRTMDNGTGCPICAESGFNPDKDAWFYLMQRPGEQQLGISNVINDRLRRHESNGWSLIEHTTVPSRGQKVLDTENAFKKWLKKEIGLMEGTTENWSTTKMEVQSLAELKARSGVETDLF